MRTTSLHSFEKSRGHATEEVRPESAQRVSSDGTVRGVVKMIAFALVIGGTAVGLHALFNYGLRHTRTSQFGAFNAVMDGRVNAEILVSGSSRALSHYDPRIIQKVTGRSAYNLGRNSSQMDLEVGLLKTYLKHNAKPGLVIQNLDLFSFERTSKGSIYDPGYYIPYLYDETLYNTVRKFVPDVWKWKYVPLYGYAVADMRFTWIKGLLSCLGVDAKEDHFLGFNPRDARWTEDFSRFRAAHPEGINFKVEPEGVAALEELIRLCQKDGIDVLLVYSPEFHEIQPMENNRKEIIGKFLALARKFDVPFWDYSDHVLSRQQELFQNSQHLNGRGAEQFSVDLANRLASGWPLKQTKTSTGGVAR